MSQPTLLAAHFDEAFSASDGLKRLRELILTLAMQGKLVEQDPAEGTASELSELEMPQGLPSTWRWVSLCDVVDVLDSLRRPVTKQDRQTGPYPYYGASGIVDYVDDFIFDEPLVLVGEDGAKWGRGDNTAFAVFGKTWVNNHAHVLRTNKKLLEDSFLIYSLVEKDLKPFITGMTVPKLNQLTSCSLSLEGRKCVLEGIKSVEFQLERLTTHFRDKREPYGSRQIAPVRPRSRPAHGHVEVLKMTEQKSHA